MILSSKSLRKMVVSVVSVAIILLVPSLAARSQPVLTDAIASTSTQILRVAEVENDPKLQTKVSFTAESQPLSELLFNLQNQSNITLLMIPDTKLPKLRVTAYVQELPLAQILSGLSRLYGVRWNKTAESTFTLVPSGRTDLEVELLKVGDINEFTGRFIDSVRFSPEHKEWSQEIRDYMNTRRSTAGYSSVPASALPNELLLKIRREKELQAALQLIAAQQAAVEAIINDYSLTVETIKTLPHEKPQSFPYEVIIRARNGQPIVSLAEPTPLVLPKSPVQLAPKESGAT